MSSSKKLLLIVAVMALSACASSHVLVGTARAPVQIERVNIYLDPPARYETIALLEASDLGANGFSAQSRMNKVVNRLKAEAAALGANGILLQGFGNQYTGSVGSGFANVAASGNSALVTGVGYSSAQYSKIGKAVAIYVPEAVDGPAQSQELPMQTSPPRVPPVQPPIPTTLAPTTPPKSDWRNWGGKTD